MSLRMLMPSENTPKRVPLILAISLVMLSSAGCTFEEEPLEERRCVNDAACIDRFGDGFVCRQVINDQEGGFCEEASGSCSEDADCDDGIFCTSETCDPGGEGATAFGCVITAREVDDGIACTKDACDEDGAQVVNDATDCECTDAADRRCDDDDPCTGDTCDTATFTCANEARGEGAPCDDGVACTGGDACDDEGACVGTPNDSVCDDGEFCNGDEVCDPTSGRANNEGCIGGIAPTNEDDGLACTDAICDEEGDAISHEPTSDCDCIEDGDCPPAEVALGCALFTCGDDFTCTQIEPAQFSDPDSPCDDGIECTQGDACQGDGSCRGLPVDALCPQGQTCNPDLGCQ